MFILRVIRNFVKQPAATAPFIFSVSDVLTIRYILSS